MKVKKDGGKQVGERKKVRGIWYEVEIWVKEGKGMGKIVEEWMKDGRK